jgi:MurNAc alpha-1-phosphate uridylyltransferase
MKTMLLAAGRGERMRPLTDQCPKPLLPVAGKPLIVWHIERLAAAGLTQIVINLSWLGEQITAALGDGSRYGVSISYSPEPWPALETGGGIFNALPLLGPEPFLLVNGDVFSDVDFGALRLAPRDLGQLVLVPNPGHNPQGDFCLQAGRIVEQGGQRLTYAGIALLRPELFAGAGAGRFALLPWLQRAREAARLGGQLHPGRWLDIGTPERLARLDAELTGVRGCARHE